MSKSTAASKVEDRSITKLKAIVSVLERSTLSVLEFEDADLAVKLSRASTNAPVLVAAPSPAMPTPSAEPRETTSAPQKEEAAEDKNVHVVRSPFVGTFYRAPSPGAPPFTDVGEAVVRGQTLCIVEAMKLMNEIESEVAGKVVAILAENAQSVQYGDPLFKIARPT